MQKVKKAEQVKTRFYHSILYQCCLIGWPNFFANNLTLQTLCDWCYHFLVAMQISISFSAGFMGNVIGNMHLWTFYEYEKVNLLENIHRKFQCVNILTINYHDYALSNVDICTWKLIKSLFNSYARETRSKSSSVEAE